MCAAEPFEGPEMTKACIDILGEGALMHQSDYPHGEAYFPDTAGVSATAWKCTKMGKMKMVRFSGIKFAMGLAYETHNPLPSHEIRRKRIRRQIFSTDAKKKIVRFQTAGIDTVSGHR